MEPFNKLDKNEKFRGLDRPVMTSELGDFVNQFFNPLTPTTQSYIDAQIAALVGSAPSILNTLGEIDNAINNDASFGATITNLIGTKEPAIAGTTSADYYRGDKTFVNFASAALSATASTYEVLTNKATTFSVLNNTLYPTTSAVETRILSKGYITGNQNITLSGDLSGNGTTSINGSVLWANGYSTYDARYPLLSTKGAANGLASLDNSGKVPSSQLPSSVLGDLQYQGGWNATTNNPTIPTAASTNQGWYYVVTTAGTTNIGGKIDWQIGDWLVSNGTTWDAIDNTDLVTSVNGYLGAVVLTKSDIGLSLVENTALSTWTGTTNITTLGTVGTGTWQGSPITNTYLTSIAWSKITSTPTTLSGYGITDSIALTTGTLAQFAATTSAQLAGVISDETGTGALVFGTSPTLVTPLLGTPTSGVLTNCTGLPIVGGTTGTLTETRGGTNQTTYTTGDILYASASNTLSKLAAVASGSYLRSAGTSTAPVWSTLTLPNTVASTNILYATGTNTVGSSANLQFDGSTLNVINGSAVVYINGQGFGAGSGGSTPTLNHPFIASGSTNSVIDVNVANTSTGTAAAGRVIGSSNTTNTLIQSQGGGYTTSGAFIQSGGILYSDGVGGLSLCAANASGALGFYTGGSAAANKALGITTAQKVTFVIGITADGGGFKNSRVTTGSVGIGSTALITVTWTTAFADANYTVQASVQDSTTTSLSLSVVHIESVTASAVTVRVINNSATTAITGTLHVTAIHD